MMVCIQCALDAFVNFLLQNILKKVILDLSHVSLLTNIKFFFPVKLLVVV